MTTDSGQPPATPDPPPTPAAAPPTPAAAPPPRPRPVLERIGMAAIALVIAVLFGIVALAAFTGGEPFLGAMGAMGCLMVLWAGGMTLFKGR